MSQHRRNNPPSSGPSRSAATTASTPRRSVSFPPTAQLDSPDIVTFIDNLESVNVRRSSRIKQSSSDASADDDAADDAVADDGEGWCDGSFFEREM